MTVTPDSPAAVARRFFRALEEERWDDAIDLVDPAAVQAHYDWWRARLGMGGHLPITIETGERSAAGNPAAGFVRVMLPPRFLSGTIRATGLESEDELNAMTPAEAMAHATIHVKQAVAEAKAKVPRPVAVTRDVDEPATEPRTMNVVIGDVQETDDLAHVVYRRLLQRGERTTMAEPIEALSMRRTADGWRVRDAQNFGLGHVGFRPQTSNLPGGWYRVRRV
jgi:hypothetical protein